MFEIYTEHGQKELFGRIIGNKIDTIKENIMPSK